jgi:hypothetical protein
VLEPTSSTTDEETKEDIALSDQIRAGLEHRVIELVTLGYNCQKGASADQVCLVASIRVLCLFRSEKI